MKTSDADLRLMFVRATDEVVPPAPWLETQVVDALRRPGPARGRTKDPGGLWWIRPGLRPVAALVAVLIAIGAVAALLSSARLLHPSIPGVRSTTQTPSPGQPPFTPSPAVRGANWPPGGTVPIQLAGAWQGPYNSALLHMAGYTWEIGDETPPDQSSTLCGPGACFVGNVVVNGSEIDFIDDLCTVRHKFGFERFTYTLTGDTLVLSPASGPGQSVCAWRIGGTYTRVSTQAAVTVPFAPSPAVRDPRWPPGSPVPAQLSGMWRQNPYSPILYLGVYTFQLGEEVIDSTTYPGNVNPDLYGNVVVNGSEIDFIAETCRYAYAPYTVERYTYTVSGDTLVIARGPGQTQCSWPKLEGTYTRVSTS
jgi:hypothetical protein